MSDEHWLKQPTDAFSIVCAECDDGMHITSREQAIAEGWVDIEYAPDLAMANYVGICPDCAPRWKEPPHDDES